MDDKEDSFRAAAAECLRAARIDSFQYFNGLPGKESVARLIDTILVPDESEAERVRNFVAGRASDFGASVPKVITFPVG